MDSPVETKEETKLSPVKAMRKVIAVGDLHGDFHRLIRIMDEQNLFISGTWAWNPEASNVDLVLLGDYVDWRGEALEGDPSSWISGIKRIIMLIKRLYENLEELRNSNNGFKSYIYPLIGNHDLMMLDAMKVFSFLDIEGLRFVIENQRNFPILRTFFAEKKMSQQNVDEVLGFYNWYYQGGDMTIESFGGLESWKEAIEGETGGFLRNKLKPGVIINRKLYAHSLPDEPGFWMNPEEWEKLEGEKKEAVIKAIVWGRKIWAFDAYTGMETSPPTQEEVERMLKMIGAEAAVIGHTPMGRKEAVFAYEGRIVNIDLHGAIGSPAYMEEY